MRIKGKGLSLAVLFLLVLSLSALPAIAAEGGDEGAVLQARSLFDGDTIITEWNVKDFGAKGDGVTDDTAAFEEALASAAARGGGIVYAPPGSYLIREPLIVESGVTLYGQWNTPGKNYEGQTVILADLPSGDEALFTMATHSSLKGLNVYYPGQDETAPVPFGPVVRATSYGTSVQNMTLVNPYYGMELVPGTGSHAENIYLSPLSKGIYIGKNYEISNYVNLNFSGDYWAAYESIDRKAFADYVYQNCIPLHIGKVDDFFMYGIHIDEADYYNEVVFEKDDEIPVDPKLAYGNMAQLGGAEVNNSDPDYYIRLNNLDDIKGMTAYRHVFAPARSAAGDGVFDVRSYGAAGDGTTDDTQAFQSALAAAGEVNGTVFVPAGSYVIRQSLRVPSGVELKGEWESPSVESPSELLIYAGENQPDSAIIFLEPGAGVQGFKVRLPQFDRYTMTPHAWIVRAEGAGCWAEDLTFVNTYRGVDFGSAKCDDFLIKGIWGTSVDNTVRVGGGSENGRIEYIMSTFSNWWEDINRADTVIEEYTYQNTVGVKLGDVKNVAGFSLCAFGIKTSLRLEAENGQGPENLRLFRVVADLPNGFNHLEAAAGDNIAIIGFSSGGGRTGSRFIRIEDAFSGKLRIYGQVTWSGTGISTFPNHDVQIYNVNSEEVEILNFSFPFDGNGLPVWAIAAIAAGAAVLAAAAVTIPLLLRKKRRSSKD